MAAIPQHIFTVLHMCQNMIATMHAELAVLGLVQGDPLGAGNPQQVCFSTRCNDVQW